jgi:hypothetical protein
MLSHLQKWTNKVYWNEGVVLNLFISATNDTIKQKQNSEVEVDVCIWCALILKKTTKNSYHEVMRDILGQCKADSKSVHYKMHSFMQELPKHSIHFAKQTVHLKWQEPIYSAIECWCQHSWRKIEMLCHLLRIINNHSELAPV